MAQTLNLNGGLSLLHKPPPSRFSNSSKNSSHLLNFADLRVQLRCNGRFSCLFNDNSKQEQAKKALESALGGTGNKEKFDKWNQEIKKREEAGGGGNGGGGGWFGWGRRFGSSNDDNFWQEAQQTILAILGIVVLYLVAAKGDLLLAVILNPLLFGLRATRNAFTSIISRITRKSYPASEAPVEQAYGGGAKNRVVNKWGSD